ncbi:hypothetical protein [Treponema pedis]|nr:hypothetical protein [Treponema pedis]
MKPFPVLTKYGKKEAIEKLKAHFADSIILFITHRKKNIWLIR